MPSEKARYIINECIAGTENYFCSIFPKREGFIHGYGDQIDQALAEERERCAKIVDNLARFIGTRYSDPDPQYNTPEALTDLHKDIAVIAARAIRNPR